MFRGEDGNLYVNRLGAASLAGREMVRYHYDGRGDLTAVYGRGGKVLCNTTNTDEEWNEPSIIVT